MRTPILSNTSLDWSSGDYASEVNIEGDQVIVEHKLQGAQVLEKLLEAREVSWVVEIRSPFSLYNYSESSTASKTEVKLDRNLMGREFYIRPMLCATSDIVLETTELSEYWRNHSSSLAIQRGTILVEDEIWVDSDVPSNIFRYEVPEKKELEDGELALGAFSLTAETPYVVYINENTKNLVDIDNTTASISIGITALTAVLGDLKVRLTERESTDSDGDPFRDLYDKVREALPEHVVVEEDQPSFDFLRLSTALQPFPIEQMISEADDGN